MGLACMGHLGMGASCKRHGGVGPKGLFLCGMTR